MENRKNKPDYTDNDWTDLIKNRVDKWNCMWETIKEEGIEILNLWEREEQIPHFNRKSEQHVPRLAILPVQKEKRGMIIVCAGGGFLFKSPNEAKPVAEAFHSYGFNAAILDYRTYPYRLDAAKEDGIRAVRFLKYHAEKLGIDKKHIAIGGFSAGGILTSMVNNEFDYGNPNAKDPIECESSRPDAAFQMYGSFKRRVNTGYVDGKPFISFDFPDRKSEAANDFTLRLPLDAPPIFMAQTDEDDPNMVLEMAKAYADRGVPHEYHLFHGGSHGGGLYNGIDEDSPSVPHTARWFTLASEWFELMGF